jgi:hypothetical protein
MLKGQLLYYESKKVASAPGSLVLLTSFAYVGAQGRGSWCWRVLGRQLNRRDCSGLRDPVSRATGRWRNLRSSCGYLTEPNLPGPLAKCVRALVPCPSFLSQLQIILMAFDNDDSRKSIGRLAATARGEFEAPKTK